VATDSTVTLREVWRELSELGDRHGVTVVMYWGKASLFPVTVSICPGDHPGWSGMPFR
jgi:hypothetical protein